MTMTRIKTVAVGLVMCWVLGLGAQAIAAAAQVSRVRAHQTDSWRLWVSAGWREVIVDGDGDTDLDLYVLDASGRMLASDEDETDYCVGAFYLAHSGYIEIRIRNLGGVFNEYRLDVN